MMVSTVIANSSNKPNSKWDYGFHEAESISFMERGIKFYIFPDGEMDFDIHANEQGTTTEYYYKSSRNNARHSQRRGTKVVRDYRGRIIRVGRVFINYNYRNQISRIGSVFIRYRRELMTKVGGMQIVYNRYGEVRYIGAVKHNYYHNYYSNYYHNYYQDYYYDNYVYSYNDHFFNDDFFNDYEQINEDENYYYYRSKGKINKRKNGKIESKQKMIKRKKQKVNPKKTPKKETKRGFSRR